MVVSAAGGDVQVQLRLGVEVEGRGGMKGNKGWQERRWAPEERLGHWGGGPVLQGPDQRHSHTFTV